MEEFGISKPVGMRLTNSANPIGVMLTTPGYSDLWLVDALEDSPLLAVDQVIHVLAARLEDLSPWLEQLGSQSRDFR